MRLFPNAYATVVHATVPAGGGATISKSLKPLSHATAQAGRGCDHLLFADAGLPHGRLGSGGSSQYFATGQAKNRTARLSLAVSACHWQTTHGITKGIFTCLRTSVYQGTPSWLTPREQIHVRVRGLWAAIDNTNTASHSPFGKV